jgi:hypothetical protein
VDMAVDVWCTEPAVAAAAQRTEAAEGAQAVAAAVAAAEVAAYGLDLSGSASSRCRRRAPSGRTRSSSARLAQKAARRS